MKVLLCALGIMSGTVAQADVRYVDDDAPLGGDGLSWTTAYRFVQDALAAATASGGAVNEIRVGHGIYRPDRDEDGNVTPGDRSASFHLIDSVSVLGGFGGLDAPDPDARDIEVFETILSGDLANDDGPGFEGNDENSLHVVIGDGSDASALIEGFTITAGNADMPQPDDRGAGLHIADGSPHVSFCRFRRNYGKNGAGVFNLGGDPLLEDCEFTENTVVGQSSTGGGMWNVSGDPALVRCVFVDNLSDSVGSHFRNTSGGPDFEHCIFTYATVDPMHTSVSVHSGTGVFNNCEFVDHRTASAVQVGGYADFVDCEFRNIEPFGAVSTAGQTYFSRCLFADNTSTTGGAIACAAASSTTIRDSVFTNDTATSLGGAMYIAGAGAGVDIANSVFTRNQAISADSTANGGALLVAVGAHCNVSNCVFYDNLAQGLGQDIWCNEGTTAVENSIFRTAGPGPVGERILGDACTLSVSYCNIQGGGGDGTGNIDADPMFADPGDGDFRLMAGSPCVDAADNDAVPEDVMTDFFGNPRFLDVPETPDTGNGDLPVVDMGVHESLGGSCLAVTSQQIDCSPDGTTFTVTVDGLNACTGGPIQIAFTGSDGAAGQELCFTAVVNDGGFCCSTEICVTIPDCPAVSGTLYVDASNCPGPGDGSEQSPFCSIQTAIDAAVETTEVVVLPGTYFESIDFLGKPITVRSVDPDDPEVVAATVIDGTGAPLPAAVSPLVASSGETTPAGGYPAVVVCESGEGADTVLSGFVITGGTANVGGMRNTGSSPTVASCTFSGNVAIIAGMYNEDGADPTVINCTFSENVGVSAGGMVNSHSSPTVMDCVFAGNTGTSGAGGVFNYPSNATFSDCAFIDNTGGFGGGMFNASSSAPLMMNCTFSDNRGEDGGGMTNAGSSPAVVNCTFLDNTAEFGGGMHNIEGSLVEVTNCTFSGNSAGPDSIAGGAAGGIYHEPGSVSLVTNCILWDDLPSEITGGIAVAFSNVEGGYFGSTNIDADPLFVDPDNADFRLRFGSPSIDAGDNAAVPGGIVTDLNGDPRFRDDPDTPDCEQAPGQCGDPPVVDMGAYEFQLCGWDCDGESNGVVGIADILTALEQWGGPGSCDFDGGNVGIADILALLANWGQCP